jgi:threonine synthase
MTPVSRERMGEERIDLKLEYLAPTGSFKDRGASVLLSRLKEMGIEEILEDSSGNAGCSLAAYAAAAGIRCRVLVPENVPEGKALQIASYGAILERIPGSRDDVAQEALRRAETSFYASHNWQPFFIQGTKTFAFEVAEQLSRLPDAIFYPVGNGSLLVGSYKGFYEMKTLGWIDKIPRLIGVQTVSHPPIYEAVTGQSCLSRAEKTIAGGIAIGKPTRLKQVSEVIRKTDGTVFVVTDDQIREAQRDLARRGYLVEPTAAAALAGYRIWRSAAGDKEQKVLIPLTGSGLKDPDSLRAII